MIVTIESIHPIFVPSYFSFTFLFIEQTAHVLKHNHISCPTERNTTHSKETSAFFLLVPKPPQYIQLHGCDMAIAHTHCMSVVYSFDSIMFVPQTNWFFRIWFYRWKRECVHMFHWCKHNATKWPLLVSLLLLPSFSPITHNGDKPACFHFSKLVFFSIQLFTAHSQHSFLSLPPFWFCAFFYFSNQITFNDIVSCSFFINFVRGEVYYAQCSLLTLTLNKVQLVHHVFFVCVCKEHCLSTISPIPTRFLPPFFCFNNNTVFTIFFLIFVWQQKILMYISFPVTEFNDFGHF